MQSDSQNLEHSTAKDVTALLVNTENLKNLQEIILASTSRLDDALAPYRKNLATISSMAIKNQKSLSAIASSEQISAATTSMRETAQAIAKATAPWIQAFNSLNETINNSAITEQLNRITKVIVSPEFQAAANKFLKESNRRTKLYKSGWAFSPYLYQTSIHQALTDDSFLSLSTREINKLFIEFFPKIII